MRFERGRSWVLLIVAALAPALEASPSADRETVLAAWREVMDSPELSQWRVASEGGPIPFSWLERWTRWWHEVPGAESSASVSARTRAVSRGAAVVFVATLTGMALHRLRGPIRDTVLTARDARSNVDSPPLAPGDRAPEEYWNDAQTFSAAGRYREGIRALLLGAMSATERRGLLTKAAGTTHQDYVRAADGKLRTSLELLVDSFERMRFGDDKASPDQFERDASTFLRFLQRESSRVRGSGDDR